MSVAKDRGKGFHGLEIPLRSVGGASAAQVVHGHGQVIEPHRHDWACITLPVLGRATETWDGGEAHIGGLGVLVHPAGACHTDYVGDEGLETVSIQFDPRWLSRFGFRLQLETSVWRVAAPGRRELVRIWSRPGTSDANLAEATASFLHRLVSAESVAPPQWLKHVTKELDDGEQVVTAALAAQLDLHPAWLARAYRAAVGEGIQEAVRRRRVGRAVQLLRRTDLPLAQVAVDCGFCDQSHMTRDMRTLIARTPLQVRSERALLESAAGTATELGTSAGAPS